MGVWFKPIPTEETASIFIALKLYPLLFIFSSKSPFRLGVSAFNGSEIVGVALL